VSKARRNKLGRFSISSHSPYDVIAYHPVKTRGGRILEFLLLTPTVQFSLDPRRPDLNGDRIALRLQVTTVLLPETVHASGYQSITKEPCIVRLRELT